MIFIFFFFIKPAFRNNSNNIKDMKDMNVVLKTNFLDLIFYIKYQQLFFLYVRDATEISFTIA